MASAVASYYKRVGGMDLPHQGGRKTLAAKMMEEAAAILVNPLTLVGLSESKV